MSMIINSYSFGGYTARTTAFLAATGITDTTIANALNTMDLALIANGLDTKMQALYPFVGGTATTHKFNFMNPVDSDAAFRLTFAGGIIHSATGATGNGSTGYANTHLIPTTDLTANSTHASYYSRTNTVSGNCLGASTNASLNRIVILLSFGDGNYYSDHYQFTTSRIAYANADKRGYYIDNRANSASHTAYRSGVLKATNVGASGSMPSVAIALMAINENGVIGGYSNQECAFASIGNGLTETNASDLYTLVQAFQTSLSRQV